MLLEQIRRHRWECERRAHAAYEAGKHSIEARYEALWQAYNRMYERTARQR